MLEWLVPLRYPESAMASAADLVRHRTFRESEEMAVHLKGFDIDLMQLEPGRFSGEHMLAGSGPVLLQGGRTGPVLLQRGTCPPHPTFCFRAMPGAGLTVNGRDAGPGEMSILYPGHEFTIRSGAGFPIATISVEAAHLRRTAREIGLESSVDSALRRHWVDPAEDAMHVLRRAWGALLRGVDGAAGTPAVVGRWANAVETGLVRALVRALATATGPSGADAVRSLDLVVRGVESVLDGQPRHAYSVRDLATSVGVSDRTLRRAVQAWYRAPTVAVVRARRLQGARRELLAARPDRNSVTSIAMSWGFDHLGRFAGDYSELFAELPSETLQREIRSQTNAYDIQDATRRLRP
jgi:AraC family ethanolamine operon transcriptional activator